MNKSDNYEKFLRLACRTSQNSTPLANVSNVFSVTKIIVKTSWSVEWVTQ